jgi:enamine deaminase RidA (YjgF/YER057c/UK114 family)
MKRRLISSGSSFEDQIGYSRAVVVGDLIFVSGTTGYNYETMEISSEVAEQAEQCLKNIEKALKEADSSLIDVVRVTYILPNADDFQACWSVLKNHFGNIKPAATMISAGLARQEMKIEIQVTAIRTS